MVNLSRAPNQKEVAEFLSQHSDKEFESYEIAEETNLNSDQCRRAAQKLMKKKLVKDKKHKNGKSIPVHPDDNIGILTRGRKEKLLRKHNIPKEEWQETWEYWIREAAEANSWLHQDFYTFEWNHDKEN